MAGPAVHIVTLGCPKNEVDSARMAARLAAGGATLTGEIDSAEVAVVNTCAFIQAATEESIAAVLELAGEWKSARPDRFLVVAGCMATRYAQDLPAELPEVDAFVPVADEERIAEVVAGLTATRLEPVTEVSDSLARTDAGPFAYVTVADGCHRSCTYCAIPAIRGDYASRPADDVVAEARLLVAGGTSEIILVGQDVSSYGRGMPPGAPTADLASLVRRLAAEVPDMAWLRLMYIQPDGVTQELLEAMATSPAACRYLDIPFQHASARVLRAMGRRGDAPAFLDLVSRVRAVMPDIKLRSTLIAGFPGETDADVDEVVSFIEAARMDYVGVFTYSPEEGTPAAELRGQLPEGVRLARTQRVADAAEAVGVEIAGTLVGRTLEVLVEGRDAEAPFGAPDVPATVGRWRGQAPEVDGAVYLDRDPAAGAIVAVRIVDALGFDLFGEVA